MPYRAHSAAKMVGGMVLAGSGDAVSGLAAQLKVDALKDILQEFFMAGGQKFNGADIGPTDVKQAILYVVSKKQTKAIRKGAMATSKFGLQVAATVGGATVGSVVPVAGTALGGLGGAVAGASLGTVVTVADRGKRMGKGFCKWVANSRGQHRKQAAATLMHCRSSVYDRADGGNPADEALEVILGEEYGTVVASNDLNRLADRLKSN